MKPKKKEVSDEVLRARHERKKEMDRIGAKKYLKSLVSFSFLSFLNFRRSDAKKKASSKMKAENLSLRVIIIFTFHETIF